MKITFLGTSDGIPRPSHFCTSTMIDINGCIYLIDTGAPVIDLMLRYGKKPDQLKAIFNTHGHSDHLAGMLQLLDLCTWAYKSTCYDIYLTELEIANAYAACVEAQERVPFPHDRLHFHIFEAGEIYADENIKVTAIATSHCEPRPSYAFLIEAEGKKLVLSGDLSYMLTKNDFPQILCQTPVDFFLCEMAHFGEEQIAPYLEKCLAKQVWFNHYQLRKEADIQALSAPGRFSFPVHMAQDGDTVEL
ncbi:MAG: MBL fold metallo-hydrolase [Clostridia bacterium]|nr:MBL fold metallo-hydrolase [Clostridia bacterium]